MKLTNKNDQPQFIVDAISNSGYTRGEADISVTQLTSPPRMIALLATNGDKVERDASRMLSILIGHSVHSYIERASKSGTVEERLFMTVEGWRVSGCPDRVEDDGTLWDIKTCKVKKVRDGGDVEWPAQLNLYAVLLRAKGVKVKRLRIYAIMTDYVHAEAERNPYYPQSQGVTLDIPLWPEDVAMDYMIERVRLHQQARVSLPECTPHERWASGGKFVVMKRGQKNAVRGASYDTREEAEFHATRDPLYYVEERPATFGRCRNWCDAAPFCKQAMSESEPITETTEE